MDRIDVVVNGDKREVRQGLSLDELIDVMGFERRGLAVAVDDEVVPRSAWAARRLNQGEQVEILTIAQGG